MYEGVVHIRHPEAMSDPLINFIVYGASFMVDAPDAYETLIIDALRGDATLFTRQDEVEQQWRFVDPIARAWAARQGPLPAYPAGTWGPAEADLLIVQDGRTWRKP